MTGLSRPTRTTVIAALAVAAVVLTAAGIGAVSAALHVAANWAPNEWAVVAGLTLGATGVLLALAEIWVRWPWAGPMALVGLALAGVGTGVAGLVHRSQGSASESVQAGVLVAGAFGAAITLFINDRRRLTETLKTQIEQDRLEQDRLRAEDERFARAVELMGHDAPEVRVGALHTLAQLARSSNATPGADPHRVQAALDVLCGYLRHDRVGRDSNGALEGDSDGALEVGDDSAVRQTALDAVLQLAKALDAPPNHEPYLVNLRGARLPKLRARRAILQTHLDLSDSQVLGDADFDGAQFLGGFLCARTQFHEAVSLAGANFSRHATFVWAEFKGDTDLSRSSFAARADFRSAKFEQSVRMAHAAFHQASVFQKCRFDRDVDFSNVRFHADASFRRAQFAKRVAFTQAHFGAKATFNQAVFAQSGNVFGRTRFAEPPTVVGAQMKGQEFVHPKSLNYGEDAEQTVPGRGGA